MSALLTPGLHRFGVLWHDNRNVSEAVDADFMAEVLAAMTQDQSEGYAPADKIFIIEDVEAHDQGGPDSWHIKIACPLKTAEWILDLEYDIEPLAGENIEWRRHSNDGMTWAEFICLFNHATRDQARVKHWDTPIRATDDNDPHAPWFKVIGIKYDDDGPLLAIEEV